MSSPRINCYRVYTKPKGLFRLERTPMATNRSLSNSKTNFIYHRSGETANTEIIGLCRGLSKSYIINRSRNDKTQRLEILVDDKIQAAYAELRSTQGNSPDAEGFYEYETREHIRKIFLEKSIGLMDYHKTYILSAQAFHLSYLLDEGSNGTLGRAAALWLREFEETALNYKIEGVELIVMTTESIGRDWLSLIGLQLLHVILLCIVASILLAIYIICLDGVCLAAFLSLCTAASLAITLGSSFTIHLLSIGTPTFNFAQAAVFVAAFQSLIQVRFLDVLVCKSEKQPKENQDVQEVEKYVGLYHKALVSSFVCYMVFIATFLATALASTELTSFRNFSSTVCIGFTLNFLVQCTFFPACARLFERHLRHPIRTLHEILSRSRSRSLSSEAEERVLLEERQNDPHQRRKRRKSVKSQLTQPIIQKIKMKLVSIMNAYFEGVVTTYSRPITILCYLTYVSFGYVGCLHFTEMIEPRLLLSPRSSAFNYLESAENDFKPFGPRFAVIGQFRGNPWQLEVLEELYRIHRGIASSEAVCNGLKENWFGVYVWSGTKEEISQLQQYVDNADSMSSYAFEYEEGDLEPIHEEPEKNIYLEKIPEYKNWLEIWRNFTKSEEFVVDYATDIVSDSGLESLLNGVKTKKDPLISFRWVYEINETVLPGEKRVLLEWFDQLVDQRNTTVVPQLFIHSFELDWWATIGAKAFDRPILILFTFGLVTVAVSLILRLVWQTFFTTTMAVSMAFGVSGYLSFHRIGLDPFTLPCVLFAMPYSNGLTYHLLDVFANGNGGGRSNWARIALRKTAASNSYCLLVLIGSSLVLLCNDFYGFRAPLIGLLILAVIAVIHVFFFLPVLFTIFPPNKKETRGLPAAKGITAQPSIRVVTDSRPHLHARRYFYDSQRAISFQSDDDPDGRIEHITCL